MRNHVYKLIFGFLSFPIYLLSSLVPRSANIWVFGAWYGNQYTDNTSYLYEYVKETKPDIKTVWLTRNKHVMKNLRNKGDNVFSNNSIYGFWYGSRAGVTFINCSYDDVNKYCINRSFKVQLWHGVPLKKIKNDDQINENIKRPYIITLIRALLLKFFPFLDEQYDLIISSGMKVTNRFESAFNIDRNKIVETGYPRMDIITSHESSYSKGTLYNEESINTCLLYAPTHRREGDGDSNYFNDLNFEYFNQFLKDNQAILLIKMHYYEGEIDQIFPDDGYSNIKLLDNYDKIDINRILYHVDVLITDYSSVFYDYLVLGRPILFSPFDLMEYQQIDREFYEDYQNSTPGKKCYNWDEIQSELTKYFLNEDSYPLMREKIFNQYFKYSDNHNSERIVDIVTNYISISS